MQGRSVVVGALQRAWSIWSSSDRIVGRRLPVPPFAGVGDELRARTDQECAAPRPNVEDLPAGEFCQREDGATSEMMGEIWISEFKKGPPYLRQRVQPVH